MHFIRKQHQDVDFGTDESKCQNEETQEKNSGNKGESTEDDLKSDGEVTRQQETSEDSDADVEEL